MFTSYSHFINQQILARGLSLQYQAHIVTAKQVKAYAFIFLSNFKKSSNDNKQLYLWSQLLSWRISRRVVLKTSLPKKEVRVQVSPAI